MPFERPSITKLVRRALADIAIRLPGADTNLRGTPEEVLAIVNAGMTHSLHGHLKWLSKQVLADLAEDEFMLRLAAIYGLTPLDGAEAVGEITITGTNAATSPAGTVWERSDGVRFVQDEDATIIAGTATIAVTAEDAGEDANTDSGSELTLTAPVAGINSTATVDGDITDGVDPETNDELRARLLLRLQNPPKGGGPGDYVNWALEVAGVTRAWEYRHMNGLGTVGLRFVLDNQEPTIIPDSPKVDEVQDYIDLLKPITADLEVLAPVAVALNFTIELTPDTVAVRDAVEAELRALLIRVAEPGTTITLSKINEAISIASGEEDHVLTVPAADVTHTTSQIAIFGTITWV